MTENNRIKKRKVARLEDLNKQKQRELYNQFDLANSILTHENLKIDLQWAKRESKMQKRIHKKDGWRAYTV